VASTVLDNPNTACSEINRVFNAALRYKRPVYIELPRDMVLVPAPSDQQLDDQKPLSDTKALQEALHDAVDIINSAKKPVIIAGVELQRFGLQELLLGLLEESKIPVASTILSKSVIVENHPQYLGVYEGAMGREEVIDYVDTSDCLILLGVFMSDINLGIFTAHLDQGKSIYVTSEKLSIHHNTYEGVEMEDFIKGLVEANIRYRKDNDIPHPPTPMPAEPVSGKRITVKYLFQRLNSFLDDNTIVIADPGDAMFAALDMTVHCESEFLSPAYYTSLGFAVPASLGVQLAKPELRPLVLVGDGAFQMTGMELASIVRFNLNPIIVILNNQGYGTERPMLDGSFNDILLWNYSRIPKVLGAGKGYDIWTEDQLEVTLREVREHKKSFKILDVHLDPQDRSQALQRLTNALGKRVK